MTPFVDAMSLATKWAPSRVRFWESERTEGLHSHCGGGVSPAAPTVDFHTFPHALLGLHNGTAHANPHQRPGYPQGIVHRRGDFGTLLFPVGRLAKTWACTGVVTWGRWTCPHPRVGWAQSWFTPSQFCAALKDAAHNFSFGTRKGGENLPLP